MKTVIELYLSYVNDFLTLSAFAEHFGFAENVANIVIDEGRKRNNNKEKDIDVSDFLKQLREANESNGLYMPTQAEESLTDLEKQVLKAFVESLYAEPGFSDVDAEDLSNETNIPLKQIRGVIASLVKKGYIHTYKNDSNFIIIYLNKDKFHLHKEWSKYEE